MDMLGYFVAKEGKEKLKRYQVINFEVVNSMDAESLILCLRRFIGCRGNVRMLRSDNGNNFIRPDRETERDRESSVKTSWRWIKRKIKKNIAEFW